MQFEFNEKFTVLSDFLIINEAILNSEVFEIDKNLKNYQMGDFLLVEEEKFKYTLKFMDVFVIENDYKFRKMRVKN